VWKVIRITVLLTVLVIVAGRTWLDRIESQSWKNPLWVGIYPLNADASATAQTYIDELTQSDFKTLETFFEREAHRYGVPLDEPIHVELYPPGKQLPPQLSPASGPLDVMWWSLKMRWFAIRASNVPGRTPSRVRIFVLYHDPVALQTVPDSHGLQKGLIGVVHAFAAKRMADTNNIVIAHELLHTLGATDKYDLHTGAPSFPAGFADPDHEPRYPQQRAEVMAGRRALSATDFEMPTSLRDVVVGPVTAGEIRWTHN
jgi:hypothetical protein